MPDPKTIKIFISYSHDPQDLVLKDELVTHLYTLVRSDGINIWSDKAIIPGQEWEPAIFKNLGSSDIILFLISPAFIKSEYCFTKEMTVAMEMHENLKAAVLPIRMRSCDWTDTPFSKIQALPEGSQFLTEWENIDRAFTNVVEGIKKIVRTIQERENYDIITRRTEIESSCMNCEFRKSANRLLDFVPDFSIELKHKYEAFKISSHVTFIEGQLKDPKVPKTEIMKLQDDLQDQIFSLLDEICNLNNLKTAA